MSGDYAGLTPEGRERVIAREQTSGDPLTLRKHLELYLFAAKNKMKNGLTLATGDMWTRGWEMFKEYSDQLMLLDAATEAQS